MKFNEVLKTLRDDSDLNQKALANKLNINPSTYRNYENGNREPNFQTLINISNFFNVSTDYLLNIAEHKSFNTYKQSQPMDASQIPDDEKQLLKLYRKLPSDLKAEIRGEIKGILRTTQEQQSATNDNASTKKVI
jgi:transcriptional regulator with XRE-family HTH domain